MSDATAVSRRTLAIEWGIRVLLGLGLVAALAIWRPGILGGTIHSFRAMALMTGVFVLAVAAEWWLRRRGARAIVWRGVFYVTMGLAVAGGVVPSFISKSVHDDESDLFSRARMARESAPMSPAVSPGPSSAPGPSSTPAGPVELGRAELSGVDHRASGDVRVARDADGRLGVRFENLDVEPGPDYFVYLVPGADKRNTDDGTRLDNLRAPKGDQEYLAPDDLRMDTPLTVLIWCRAFAVPVANATIG